MLTQVSVRRLQLVNYLSSSAHLESHLTICLIQMVDVILLLIPSLLIFEKFSHDTLLVRVGLPSTSLNIHSSTMDSVELIFLVSSLPRGSLPTSCSRADALHSSLSDGWSRYFHLSCRAWNQILRLVATRLNHEALIVNLLFILYRASINRLPSVPCTTLWNPLILSIDQTVIRSSTLIPAAPRTSNILITSFLALLLVNYSNRKLSDVNRVIRVIWLFGTIMINYIDILVNHIGLLFIILLLTRARISLDWSEPATYFVTSAVDTACSAWRYQASSSNVLLPVLLVSLHFYAHLVRSLRS